MVRDLRIVRQDVKFVLYRLYMFIYGKESEVWTGYKRFVDKVKSGYWE